MTDPQAPTDTPDRDDPAVDAVRDPMQQALTRRFRHTLHTGQVSPLLHLVLRYRQEVRPCPAQS